MEVQWARVDGKVRSQRIRSCNPLCHPIHTSHDLEFDHNSKRLKTFSEEINGRNLEVGSQSVLQALPPPLPLDWSAPAPFCKEEGFSPRFSHPGIKYLSEGYKVTSPILQIMALNLFNSGKKGTNFELVKCGPVGICHIKPGFIKHLNFKAKNKDDPGAPVETFFAEVVNGRKYVFALFCVRLDPSNSISPEKFKVHGCAYCKRSSRVYHPQCTGYLTGRECVC